MPRTRRDEMKGRTAKAYMHLENCLLHLNKLDEAFSENHQNLAEGLETAAILVIKAQEVIKTFYEMAWGELPESWEKTTERY